MPEPKRILFLYTELANYFLVCVKELQKQTNCQIHIVHWPLNIEAPFQLDLEIKDTFFYDRNKYSLNKLKELVSKINPKLIYCSGWIDKDYIKICKNYNGKVPVVGGFDTHWNGNFKQYLRSFISPFTVKKYFSHLWIAGQPQLKYAQKLGFKETNILYGVYSADVNHFNHIYDSTLSQKTNEIPKRFIFVGRYLEFKGIYDLWQAFIKTFDHVKHEWELICLGTGADWEKRMQHPQIKHIGFVQPKDIDQYMEKSSVFVLPSHFEPWGVVLHEFAAAGFPLICSDKIGSASVFLQNEKNGFVFPANNIDSLTQCFLKFINMSSQQMLEFGKTSNNLSKTLTPTTWSNTISSLF